MPDLLDCPSHDNLNDTFTPPTIAPIPQKSSDRWRTAWKLFRDWVIDVCTRDRSEPRIWTRTVAGRAIVWHAHDPMTGRSFITSSEQEMRSWIESCYRERMQGKAIAPGKRF